MSLILPERIRAEAEAQIEAKRAAVIDYWNPLLKQIDPTLDLVQIKPNADDPNVIPGYWHLRRNTVEGFPWFFPITGPDGEFREPDHAFLEELKANDLWNPAVHRNKQEARIRREQARTRHKELRSEQQLDEVKSLFKAAKRVKGEGGFKRRTDKR
jgi:hypothetical protein